MSLMYTFKGFRPDGSQFCYPCCGAYEIVVDLSANCSGHMMVRDVQHDVWLSTRDYLDIYIENAEGKTINRVRAPAGAGEPFRRGEAQGTAHE
ncbi:hypothetical protein E8F20_05810 [Pseudomonas sp. BN415]|uniref:hypothetical protein n=1 Tax=Pseudomonas sp. BN415 TaxID=2567889 RepID=UPI0024584B45|nr:hypothetical protein [Pseudomonas sp. BN415]MDH4581391.1 hypothetical protein [Pseudomonas sp. BN415]